MASPLVAISNIS